MDPDRPLDDAPRTPGRFVSAWRALQGHSVTQPQMQAEWIQWQLAMSGVLDQLASMVGRIDSYKAKLDNALRRLDELDESAPNPINGAGGETPSSSWAYRGMLNRRAAAIDGLVLPRTPAQLEVSDVNGTEG